MDNKQFKELQKEWYSRISEKGFKDIEMITGQLRNKNYSTLLDVTGYTTNYNHISLDDNIDYFNILQYYAYNYPKMSFRNPINLNILKTYCDIGYFTEANEIHGKRRKDHTVYDYIQKNFHIMLAFYNGREDEDGGFKRAEQARIKKQDSSKKINTSR